MSPWFILAQAFGVITITLEFISYQIKNRRKYFLFAGISSFFWAFMFVFMGLATGMSTQTTLIIAATYSTIRALVFWWIFKKDSAKRKKAGRIFLGSMIVVALIAGTVGIVGFPPLGLSGVPAEVRWMHIMGFVFALLFVIGQYLPGRHYVRIAVVFYAAAVLLTQTPLNILYPDPATGLRWNIMGILIEVSKIVSVIVFYLLLLRRKYINKELGKIKLLFGAELEKMGATSAPTGEIAKRMPPEELEKLAAKMIRYELSVIESDDMQDIKSVQEKASALLSDMRCVQEVKDIISKEMEAKKVKLEAMPVGKLTKHQDDMKSVILSKASLKEDEVAEENTSYLQKEEIIAPTKIKKLKPQKEKV
ncbi:MAG: YgjV family protein [Firmicutes bacterium]|nr:YgjV family protein [Bacillota bacterium]